MGAISSTQNNKCVFGRKSTHIASNIWMLNTKSILDFLLFSHLAMELILVEQLLVNDLNGHLYTRLVVDC